MIDLSKNIVLCSLLILFVVSTSGINIFIHHCACHEEEQVSLFVEDECSGCENEDEIHVCCNHAPAAEHKPIAEIHESCCMVHEECSNELESHSICNTTQRFFQVTDDYVESSPERIPQPLQLALFILSDYLSIVDTEEAAPSNQYEYGPPIGLQKDGLELIYFYSCLKIPVC